MEAKKWRNFTNEDFTWKYGGVSHTFKAGQEIYLEDFKAAHFTKHLVDKELNRLRIPTNSVADRKRLEAQCYPEEDAVTPEVALNLNERVKRGTKKVSEKVEEVFADLVPKKVKPRKKL